MACITQGIHTLGFQGYNPTLPLAMTNDFHNAALTLLENNNLKS